MSAFIVSHDHIDALITYAINQHLWYYDREQKQSIQIIAHNATEVGRILYAENIRSVRRRYKEDFGNDGADYAYTPFNLFATKAASKQVVRACYCLDYQSCENDDWEDTQAALILSAIERHAAFNLCEDDKTWEINRGNFSFRSKAS
jgi:hypothetical protein